MNNNHNNGNVEKFLFLYEEALYVCANACINGRLSSGICMLSSIVHVADHHRLCIHVNFHDDSFTIR